MTQKKPVNTVAIGVGVLCVVLLIAVIAIYLNYTSMLNGKDSEINSLKTQLANAGITPNPNANQNQNTSDKDAIIANLQNQISDLQNQLNQKNSDIDSLNSQIANLKNQISDLQNQLNQKNSDIDSLNSQIANLNSIVNLQKYTVWVNDQTVSQPNHAYYTWTFSADYAGYVAVHVQSSTVPGTYVKVEYSAYGVNFNQEITVNVGSTAVFPILPSSSIKIGVGNALIIGSGATETVTITYFY
jgi:uncharacterized protein HemX